MTRNFDLCVAPKSVAGEATKPYVFSGIDRSEYSSLYSFLSTKKLRIKNIKQSGNDGAMLQLGNVDDHDAYKAALDEDQVTQMKAGDSVCRFLEFAPHWHTCARCAYSPFVLIGGAVVIHDTKSIKCFRI